MTETIQQLKEDIAILQEKLQKLEELEKTKTPVEECYKDWWGEYPGDENWTSDATRWQGFQAGYNAAYEEKVAQEPEENEWKSVALRFGEKLSGYLSDGYYELSPAAWFRWAVFTYGKGQQIKNAVRESVRWCEENPDKDPLDCLKPQTPEQVADGLKEAFREAVKQGVVSSVDKPPTLYDICQEWCDDEDNPPVSDLIAAIEQWLPKEHDTNSYKWNECIRMIREKLR